MEVRKVYFENTNGNRINCLLKSSFFNDLQGLGYEDSSSYVNYGDGFYNPFKRETAQGRISGRLSFITRATAYADYRTLTEWISAAEAQNDEGSIKLIYCPYGNDEYAKDVIFSSISKGELDLGGYLSCTVELESLTPWYSVTPITFTSESSDTQYKTYDYNYDYTYQSDSAIIKNANIISDTPGRFRLEIEGVFDSPIFSLYDTSNNLLGMMDLGYSGESFANGDKFIFSTLPGDIGVWREDSNGNRTSLINGINIHDGVEVFFSVPARKTVRFSLRSLSGTGGMNATLRLYSYYRTR